MKSIFNINVLRFIAPDLFCSIAAKSSYVAVAWWLLASQDSLLEFTLIVSIATFSEAFFIPILAPLNDKFGHARVYKFSIITSLISSAVLVIIYNFLQEIFLYSILLSLVVIVLSSSVRTSGMNGIINKYVDADDVQLALRSKFAFSTVVTIGAPIIGAFSASIGGVGLAILVGLGCYIVSVALIALLWKLKVGSLSDESVSPNAYFKDLKEGFNAIYIVKTELFIGMLSATVNFIIGPFFAIILPLFVARSQSLQIIHLGYLEACFAIGMFLGASKGVPLFTKMTSKYICVLSGYFFLATSLAIFSFSTEYIALLFAMAFGGIGLPLINTHLIAMRILATPSDFVARISGAVSGLCMISMPFGNLFFGLLLGSLDTQIVVGIMSLTIILLMLLLPAIPNLLTILKVQKEDEIKEIYLKIYPEAFGAKREAP
jgi:DHA3 family macrolide efflux protein-like MFS transporter